MSFPPSLCYPCKVPPRRLLTPISIHSESLGFRKEQRILRPLCGHRKFWSTGETCSPQLTLVLPRGPAPTPCLTSRSFLTTRRPILRIGSSHFPPGNQKLLLRSLTSNTVDSAEKERAQVSGTQGSGCEGRGDGLVGSVRRASPRT